MSLYGLSKKVPKYYIIINSKFMSQYVDNFVNNTQTFQINDARQIPIVVPSFEQLQQLEILFFEVIRIKKSNNNLDEMKKIEEKMEKIILDIYQF